MVTAVALVEGQRLLELPSGRADAATHPEGGPPTVDEGRQEQPGTSLAIPGTDPSELLAPIWADVSQLEEWMGATSALWPRTKEAAVGGQG